MRARQHPGAVVPNNPAPLGRDLLTGDHYLFLPPVGSPSWRRSRTRSGARRVPQIPDCVVATDISLSRAETSVPMVQSTLVSRGSVTILSLVGNQRIKRLRPERLDECNTDETQNLKHLGRDASKCFRWHPLVPGSAVSSSVYFGTYFGWRLSFRWAGGVVAQVDRDARPPHDDPADSAS